MQRDQPVDPDDQYARFATFYDLEHAQYDADLDLYRQFAMQANGPVLELGCGTGRVLRALEHLGLPLTGIDNSDSMLAIARERLAPSTALIRRDMTRLSDCRKLPNAPFWMAFSAINTFLHLPDAEAQRAALESLREVVVPRGLLLLDLMVPEPTYLSSLDGRVILEFSGLLPDGSRLEKWVVRTHDLSKQTIVTAVVFDVTDSESGIVRRIVDRYQTRYIHRFELEHLLATTGWELVSVYGSYDLEPYDSDAERMIALATWSAAVPDGEESNWHREI
jgi:SAM-dependent methyltransferase